MGRLIVSMNLSVDGYIEGPGREDGSWVRIDEEAHTHINRLAAGADALLYGRKTYEVMIPYWPDAAEDASKPPYEIEFGRIWTSKPKVVFSTTLKEARWNTRVVEHGVAEQVARLKRETPNYLLSFGGADVASTLQQHGLIDEYQLFVHPSVFGSGVAFFRHSADLELLDARTFKTGVVALRYAPVPS
jgi:dihydrofolate reductase